MRSVARISTTFSTDFIELSLKKTTILTFRKNGNKIITTYEYPVKTTTIFKLPDPRNYSRLIQKKKISHISPDKYNENQYMHINTPELSRKGESKGVLQGAAPLAMMAAIEKSVALPLANTASSCMVPSSILTISGAEDHLDPAEPNCVPTCARVTYFPSPSPSHTRPAHR